MSIRRKLGWDEVERETGIARNVNPAPTRLDAQRLERKVLGSLWGRKRRKAIPPR